MRKYNRLIKLTQNLDYYLIQECYLIYLLKKCNIFEEFWGFKSSNDLVKFLVFLRIFEILISENTNQNFAKITYMTTPEKSLNLTNSATLTVTEVNMLSIFHLHLGHTVK